MNIDEMHEVADTSPATLAMLDGLIAASRTEEQFVYREIELDELWRLLAIDKKWASGAAVARIQRAMDIVMEAHDLIGVDGDHAAAAQKLRSLPLG